MNDLVVKNVNLFGDTIVAAQDKDGNVWAGVKWICDGLGLTKGQTQNERLKIHEDEALKKGERNLVLPTKGGKQEVLCLRNDFVPLWIAKITVTPAMKENNPDLSDKLIEYQLKAKDVLAAEFLPQEKPKRRLSEEEMMRIQLGMLDKQGERLDGVEERVDYLENTMTIDYGQQKQIKNFGNEVVVNALGGKNAPAYRYRYADNSKMSSQCFSRFWHDFDDYFDINAYANLPKVRFEEALAYINRWQPPINMQLEIGKINRGEI